MADSVHSLKTLRILRDLEALKFDIDVWRLLHTLFIRLYTVSACLITWSELLWLPLWSWMIPSWFFVHNVLGVAEMVDRDCPIVLMLHVPCRIDWTLGLGVVPNAMMDLTWNVCCRNVDRYRSSNGSAISLIVRYWQDLVFSREMRESHMGIMANRPPRARNMIVWHPRVDYTTVLVNDGSSVVVILSVQTKGRDVMLVWLLQKCCRFVGRVTSITRVVPIK